MRTIIHRGGDSGHLEVIREDGDPRIKDESHLLYRIKRCLIAMNYDVIKKRMQKDGHMYGDERLQYVRTRKLRSPDSFYIYDGDYAIRNAAEAYRRDGRIIFSMMFNVGEDR